MAPEAGAGNEYALTMFNRDIERRREQEEFINGLKKLTDAIEDFIEMNEEETEAPEEEEEEVEEEVVEE